MYHTARRVKIFRRALVFLPVLALSMILSYFLFSKLLFNTFAASSSPWTQTNWSGGLSSDVVTGTVTTYNSISNISTATAGQISLSETAGWDIAVNAWQYRKDLVFDNSTINEALAPFTVLVKLDPTEGEIDYSKVNSDGSDLRFVDPSGTVLDHEIELWDTGGISYIWVQVPQIDALSSTDYIRMYYGNSGALYSDPDYETWDGSSSFGGVWHFGETPDSPGNAVYGSYRDVPVTAIDGVSVGGMDSTDLVAGQIGYGFDFDGNNDHINYGDRYDFRLTDARTISAWINPDDVSGSNVNMIMTKQRITAAQDGWAFSTLGKYLKFKYVTDNTSGAYLEATTTSEVIDIGSWYHVAVTFNSQIVKFYVNGNPVASAYNSFTASGNIDNSINANVGSRHDNSTTGVIQFDGKMDEPRFATAARSDAWIKANYLSETDSYISFQSEEQHVASSGTLVSNVFDVGIDADWGILSYSSSGSGTLQIKARSDSSPDMSGASDFSSCTALTNGNSISDDDPVCVTNGERYLQYQVTMLPSGTNSPILQNLSFAFEYSDQVAPETNASGFIFSDGRGDEAWFSAAPTIEWSAGVDDTDGSGILGYCLSIDEVAPEGSPPNTDPELSSGDLDSSETPYSHDSCPFVTTETSLDISALNNFTFSELYTYHFSIKALDLAGNVYTGDSATYLNVISFGYDTTAPTNVDYISTPNTTFTSIDDMEFTWPVTGDAAATDGSGILGYQYSINDTESWGGPYDDSALGLSYIQNTGSISSYQLSDATDGASINVGNNAIYFRAIDYAGNISTFVSGNLAFGGNAPQFPQNAVITVTPDSNDENLFALSWPEAQPADGEAIKSYYYMINTQPPSTIETLESNSSLYIPTTSTSVAEGKLIGSIKGDNTVCVAVTDENDHYSPSNKICASYTLDSTEPDPPKNLYITDASIKSAELWRSTIVWEEPDYQGNGDLTYLIERSTDDSTWTEMGTTTGLAYTDTVDESRLYFYRVAAYDTSDDSQNSPSYAASVSITPKGVFEEPPDIVSGPKLTFRTTTKATIVWSTSRGGDSKIQYGTASGDYFEEEPSKSSLETDHEINLINLKPGTTYYYKVKSTDEDGNTAKSGEKIFTTKPAPTVSDPNASNIGLFSAILSFTVENASKAKVYYGTSTNFGSTKEVFTSSKKGTYSLNLSGLQDDTKYYFKVNTFDEDGLEYDGNAITFTTLPRPRISDIKIQQIRNSASPTILVSWQSNTEVTSVVTYFPTSDEKAKKTEADLALIKGEHKLLVSGLQDETQYSLTVSGKDSLGNSGESSAQIFSTATDTRPPEITNLKVESSVVKSTGDNQVQLIVTWQTDEPATSQVEYGEGTGAVYTQRTTREENLKRDHFVTISGVKPAQVYHLRAGSIDESGNESLSSDTLKITNKTSQSAFDLVLNNLKEIFNFLK